MTESAIGDSGACFAMQGNCSHHHILKGLAPAMLIHAAEHPSRYGSTDYMAFNRTKETCWWRSPPIVFCLAWFPTSMSTAQAYNLHPKRHGNCYSFPSVHLKRGNLRSGKAWPERLFLQQKPPTDNISHRTSQSPPRKPYALWWFKTNTLAHRVGCFRDVWTLAHKPCGFGYTVRREHVRCPILKMDENRQPARRKSFAALLCSVLMCCKTKQTLSMEKFLFPSLR